MADPISAILVGTAAKGATASTAGLLGSAGSFSLGATLSTLGAAGGLLSTFSGARAAKVQSENEARQYELNVRAEEVRDQEEANEIKRDVARALASSNARGAASGISISSGSPVQAQQEALTDANNALSTVSTNTKLRAETEKVRAQIARQRGRECNSFWVYAGNIASW